MKVRTVTRHLLGSLAILMGLGLSACATGSSTVTSATDELSNQKSLERIERKMNALDARRPASADYVLIPD